MYILHYAPDNASLIVRMVLEELAVPYRTTLIDRKRQAQRSAAYLALNPRGLIPVLETPDGPVFETAAILLWLTDRHGALAPTPDDPGRGAYLSWLFAVSNGLHADLRQMFYPRQYAADGDAAHRDLCIARIRAHLDRLESLASQHPDWFCHADPSALDYYLAALGRWMALYPVGETDWFDPAGWPRLAAAQARLETRPAVQTAARAEGLGPRPFTRPDYAQPPEGSAT